GVEHHAVGDGLAGVGEVLAHEGVVETELVGKDDGLAVLFQRLGPIAVHGVHRHGEVAQPHSRLQSRATQPLGRRSGSCGPICRPRTSINLWRATCALKRLNRSRWQIYYYFFSAKTKILLPKLRCLPFAKMRVAFVSPKSVAVPVRAQVARVIVNNRPETMVRSRRPFLAAAGWFSPASSAKTPLASFRQNAPRPHAEEHRSANTDACTSRLRCDASRSMKPRALTVLIFDTRARRV